MPHRIASVLVCALIAAPAAARAQTFAAGADLYFYGDNTEFANPFRSGDTTLGTSGRIFLDAILNDTVTIRIGGFGLGRFGAHDALEHAEPVIALRVSRGSSRLLFGSLETVDARHDVAGPDEETPHRLLPPLQQETLAFTRGQEMGLQWIVDADHVEHDTWINWQRLNTATHRERFDAGYRSSVALSTVWRLHGQWHVVHEGGQRFNSGPVSDSHAAAIGLQWADRVRAARLSVDAHVMGTRYTPDREEPDLIEGGVGIFARAVLARDPWRVHLIVWRSRDTLKAEGDPNYLAERRDGTIDRKVRDYAEWGLTRHFRPAPQLHMFAAFRMHRVESHYEYSYRIVGRVRLRHVF
jgi:hypothetical protein